MSNLSTTLANIIQSPLSPDENAVTTDLNDTDTSMEEYYVCIKCEYLGDENHNHDNDESNNSANSSHEEIEEEDEDALNEPQFESALIEEENEPSVSNETITPQQAYAANEVAADSSAFVQKSSVGVQTDSSVILEASVTDMIDYNDVRPVAVNHEAESNNHKNDEKETTELHDHSFSATVFEPMNEFRTSSQLSNTASTGSPVETSSNSGRALSTPLPQTPQVKIESKELLSIFQRSPENVIADLSKLLKSAGVHIENEDDPDFVNELKDVKIKIETPHSIKQESTSSRKRKCSSKFYTPAKRRVARKGAIGTVKTRKTGETKAFVEWDSDAYIESD